MCPNAIIEYTPNIVSVVEINVSAQIGSARLKNKLTTSSYIVNKHSVDLSLNFLQLSFCP